MKPGERIKFMRTQMGLTQKELGEKCFVSRSHVKNWESGSHIPNPEDLKIVETLYTEFQKHQQDLFFADDEKFPEQLRAFRLERKLSQGELAELVGVGRGVLNKWENGNQTPARGNIKKLRNLQQQATGCVGLKTFSENFPEKLKALQEYLVCTRGELAKTLGISLAVANRWASGTAPTIAMVRKLEQFCTERGIDFNNPSEVQKMSPDEIIALRKKFGLSQDKLAKVFHVNKRTLHSWELGKTEPRPKQQRKLAVFQDKAWFALFERLEFLLNDKEFSIKELAKELNDITDNSLQEYSVLNWMAKVSYPNDKQLAAIDRLCTSLGYKPTKEKEA